MRLTYEQKQALVVFMHGRRCMHDVACHDCALHEKLYGSYVCVHLRKSFNLRYGESCVTFAEQCAQYIKEHPRDFTAENIAEMLL